MYVCKQDIELIQFEYITCCVPYMKSQVVAAAADNDTVIR